MIRRERSFLKFLIASVRMLALPERVEVAASRLLQRVLDQTGALWFKEFLAEMMIRRNQ